MCVIVLLLQRSNLCKVNPLQAEIWVSLAVISVLSLVLLWMSLTFFDVEEPPITATQTMARGLILMLRSALSKSTWISPEIQKSIAFRSCFLVVLFGHFVIFTAYR